MIIRLERAIVIIEASRESHAYWLRFVAEGGSLPELLGDLAFHEQCVAEYEDVLEVLKDARSLFR